jgi:hypothetical protein
MGDTMYFHKYFPDHIPKPDTLQIERREMTVEKYYYDPQEDMIYIFALDKTSDWTSDEWVNLESAGWKVENIIVFKV